MKVNIYLKANLHSLTLTESFTQSVKRTISLHVEILKLFGSWIMLFNRFSVIWKSISTHLHSSFPPVNERWRCRQLRGGGFLMGLRDVTSSEKIFKVKSLLQEDLDIDNVKVENANDDETTSRLLSHTGHHAMFSRTSFSITWQQGSSTSYCTLHTEKVKKRLGNCCKEHWTFVWKFSFWKLRFLWSSNLVERRIDHSIHWFSKLCVHSFRNLGLFSWCYYSIRLTTSHSGRA